MKSKPYKAKTLSGAQARVRLREKQYAELEKIAERLSKENKLLARLAAGGPCFGNPMEAAEAVRIRDQVLQNMGLRPDDTRIKFG